jgi:TRAP-type C4-dicarboxylate transport system permease small subunit
MADGTAETHRKETEMLTNLLMNALALAGLIWVGAIVVTETREAIADTLKEIR